MKYNTQYIVYSIEPKKQVKGLIGTLDIYVIQLLLVGGRVGIEENIETGCPVEF